MTKYQERILKEQKKLKKSALKHLKKMGYIPDSFFEEGVHLGISWVGVYARPKNEESYTGFNVDNAKWFEWSMLMNGQVRAEF